MLPKVICIIVEYILMDQPLNDADVEKLLLLHSETLMYTGSDAPTFTRFVSHKSEPSLSSRNDYCDDESLASHQVHIYHQ